MPRSSLRFGFFALVALQVAHAADFHLNVGASGRTCDYTSIQAAIDAASSAATDTTFIHIARDQTYNAQAIDIDGKNIHLLGGYATCAQGTPDGIKTALDGSGGSQRSLINVRGTTRNVQFKRLSLHNGNEQSGADSYGGAVDITEGPHALVRFEDTSLVAGNAGWGGALSVRNASVDRPQDVLVRFGPGNTVFNNRAHYGGGGIYCKDATLDLDGSNNLVTGNYAGDTLGHGGGMYLDDCFVTLADASDAGVVNNNTAVGNGGGIYATGQFAQLDVYTVNPMHPTRIKNNVAGGYGGGLDIEHGPVVVLWNANIEDNTARAGGGGVAVYSEAPSLEADRTKFRATSALSEVWCDAGCPLDHAPTGAVVCDRDVPCNAFSGNEAFALDGTPRDGAAVRMSSDAQFGGLFAGANAVLRSILLANNSGRNLLFVRSWQDDAVAQVEMSGSVVTDNSVSGNLIEVAGDEADVVVRQSSIAQNVIGGAGVFKFEENTPADNQSEDNLVSANVVWQPGKLFFVNAPLQVEARYNVVNEQSLVPSTERVYNIEGDPLFQSPAQGDYRLLTGSPALDLAPYTVESTRDGLPRIVDLPGVPNGGGPVDAGAYELARTNQPPTAYPLQTETLVATPVSIELSGNDPDGDPIEFRIVELPQHGVLSGTPPHLTYTPVAGFIGVDSFQFVAHDGITDSLPARVEIGVSEQPNRPPVGDDQQVTTTEDEPLVIVLTATDPDGDAITFGIESAPTHGGLSGSGPSFTYTPDPGYLGSDAFTFRAIDPESVGEIATVSISVVEPINNPPVGDDQQATTPQDTLLNIVLTGSDPDGDPLSFDLETIPAHGTLGGAPPNLTYTPFAGYIGPDEFRFRAVDGMLASAEATVSITVTPIAPNGDDVFSDGFE